MLLEELLPILEHSQQYSALEVQPCSWARLGVKRCMKVMRKRSIVEGLIFTFGHEIKVQGLRIIKMSGMYNINRVGESTEQ